MSEITNKELLDEVRPSFEKAINSLLGSASSKLNEIRKLLEEAAKLAELIGDKSNLNDLINRLVVSPNTEVIEDLSDVNRQVVSLPTTAATKCALDGKEVQPVPDQPRYIDTCEDTRISLITGKPLDNIKRSTRKEVISSASKTIKKATDIGYGKSKSQVEYIGVTVARAETSPQRYRARLCIKGVSHEIGTSDTALEAAYAYDEFKYKLTQSLKGLNFPERIQMRINKKRASG